MSLEKDIKTLMSLPVASIKPQPTPAVAKIAPVKKTSAETWQFIVDQCAEGEKAEKLSDAELAETLQRKIADHINMNEPAFALIAEAADRLAKSQSTPTVAKIAAEVAADLEDYVEVDQGGFGGPIVRYRTAEAQEMIERAFAGFTYTGEQK